MSQYSKAIVGAVGVLVNALYQYNVSHPSAWVTALIAVLTVAGVYQAKNSTPAQG